MNYSNAQKFLYRWSIVVTAFMYFPVALAQEQSFNFEITPYGAYRFGGEFEEATGNIAIEVDDNSSYGLILNAKHSPITQWEILYSHQETSADTLGLGLAEPVLDIDLDYLHAGGTYLWDGEHVRPFLSATVGVTQVDVSTAGYDSDSFFSFSLGLGLQVRPSDRLGIRLEARSFGTMLDTDTDLFCQFGPANNICAVRIDGSVLWQLEAIAGIVFRF